MDTTLTSLDDGSYILQLPGRNPIHMSAEEYSPDLVARLVVEHAYEVAEFDALAGKGKPCVCGMHGSQNVFKP